jgi:hypothetical protein
MKKVGKAKSVAPRRTKTKDELRPHYDLDYSKSRPNRFASKFAEGSVAVLLDADVAAVFHSSEAVNSFLRSAIAAMPQEQLPRKRRAS